MNIGDAFNYGWQKFQQNWQPILLAALVYFVGFLVVGGIWYFIVAAILPNSGLFAWLLTTAVGGIVWFALFYLVQAGITRGALALTDGRQLELATFLSTDNLAQIAIGGVVLGVATAIGSLLCYIPGLIVAFFGQFFVFFAVDQNLGGIDAIKASVAFVNEHIGTLVGFYLASLVAWFIGSLLCGVGMLVAFPVVIIAQAYMYRRLHGQPVTS